MLLIRGGIRFNGQWCYSICGVDFGGMKGVWNA